MNAKIEKMNETRKTVKPIRIEDSETGKEYTLEFSRRTVLETNELGFAASKIRDNMQRMLPLLWYGAFLKNHRKEVSQADTENLLYNMGGLTDKILTRLIDLYEAPTAGLYVADEDEDTTKNAKVLVHLD